MTVGNRAMRPSTIPFLEKKDNIIVESGEATKKARAEI